MKTFSKTLAVSLALFGAVTAANATSLIVNGGFEAPNNGVETPSGWANVGHTDGVLTYARFNTPVYEGSNYYDLGGYGDVYGPLGDGIKQSFETVAGSHYTVTFGISSENIYGGGSISPAVTLTVAAGDASADYVVAAVEGKSGMNRPFVTKTLDFVALGSSTTLSFIHTAGTGGYNDPMIDGVSVVLSAAGDATVAAVPEPETYAMMLAGLGALGFFARRRKSL